MNETVKMYSFATLIGFLVFIFILDDTRPNMIISTAKNVMPFKMPSSLINISLEKPYVFVDVKEEKQTQKISIKKCNIFDGRWVYKPEDEANYDATDCPFVEEKMSCHKNGRPDSEYMKWKWEANDCELPMFDGKYMMERLRNKRMILAGDSLNRNMWESLACLLHSSVDPSTVELHDNSSTSNSTLFWKSKEYNFTVEFYWSPFLIEITKNHESGKKVLHLDKLSSNSNMWIGADVMVFNSGFWWLQNENIKRWDFFEYQGKLIEDMPMEVAYERGMRTWATWIEKNVNHKKTSVFFRSISVEHKTKNSGKWCYNKTQLTLDDSLATKYPNSLIDIIERLISGFSKLQVKYLNITKLSQYRIDAHPSIYRYKEWKNLSTKYNDIVSFRPDCSHWCLPGVPDTWNKLLYTTLLFDSL